ncbi:TPA: heavy metal translocating P-type ATPase [Staphylococcus aureus]|uniref:heavy metal translocating P-type ATPase n=2 Tax=Staphylococcus aureus TaxID=1280 RepID=UPI0006B476CD|nr:heavy metal translocating P-type ATPase [Staphylococcus aureus]APW74512.1 ATPase [Staphylococcus aureus]KOZ99256.1 ATPase [Staphylococcus aureus]MDO6987514.1 heavy metal translocating P-type ATPase [Staphylococcus aureus]MDO6995912.1 heavy metal translocating P-type ATPase [Staphylococcus aureus]MDO6998458.1 heavy metal translocating P-type ATPase [Staphylococcus aureus]
MFNYLFTNRQGQFLVAGIIFIILGFALMPVEGIYSSISFYIAIFFLGFYASKNAVIETIRERSPNVDLLMILAAIGAVIINYESEGALLLLIFAGAEVLENYATSKSTKAISELMSHLPSTASRIGADGEITEIPTEELIQGDIVLVAKGEQIPIDGQADRQVSVNEAALTGESVPVVKEKDEEVFAGTVNDGNSFRLTVTKTSDDTIFSNIVRMVEEAQQRPSKLSKTIDRIESKYVISVLIGVPVFIAILYFFNNLGFEESFYRGMVMLTVASPCALVASATPATLSAISNGAKNGILFKGGAAMEALSTMEILYSDKTGTLTYGDFVVEEYAADEDTLKEVVTIEQHSSHPIAEAIVKKFKTLDLDSVDDSEPVEEIVGSGMKKGDIIVGKPDAFKDYTDPSNYRDQIIAGNTNIFVGESGQITGYFDEAVHAVENFQNSDIEVVLLTGDNETVAEKVAGEVGITDYTASCLPEDKVRFVNESQKKSKIVGMIGDGINDAPALANADIGIAMGSGSSVAMESSDVVIVKNNLQKLFYSFMLSNRLNRIILANIIFSISVIVILVLLNIFGLLNLPTAVLFHEGSTILVILNGLRLLRAK